MKEFKKIKNKELIKWLSDIDNIEGWMSPTSGYISSILVQYQEYIGFEGNIAEIGVYHGKYCCGLATGLKNDETLIAIDIFENQNFNEDLTGYDEVGSVGIHSLQENMFLENTKKYIPNKSLKIINKNSLDVEFNDLIITNKKIRFFSIDGGHNAKVFLNDLKLAEEALTSHGIISIDDILNPQWGGIVTETVRFFDSDTKLSPFAFLPNKLLCCSEEYVDLYKSILMNTIAPLSIQRKDVEFSNYLVDQYMDGNDYLKFLENKEMNENTI